MPKTNEPKSDIKFAPSAYVVMSSGTNIGTIAYNVDCDCVTFLPSEQFFPYLPADLEKIAELIKEKEQALLEAAAE